LALGHGDQFSGIGIPSVAEPVVVAELVEVKPPSSLVSFPVVALTLRQAQRLLAKHFCATLFREIH